MHPRGRHQGRHGRGSGHSRGRGIAQRHRSSGATSTPQVAGRSETGQPNSHHSKTFYDPAGHNTETSFEIPGFTTAAQLLLKETGTPAASKKQNTKIVSPGEEEHKSSTETSNDSSSPDNAVPKATATKPPQHPSNSAHTDTANPSTPDKATGTTPEYDPLSPTTLELIGKETDKLTAGQGDTAHPKETEKQQEDTEDKETIDLSEDDDSDKRATSPTPTPFDIPDAAYKFDASKNQNPSSFFIAELNKEPDFHKAIEPLEPQEQMKTRTALFRAQMQGVSLVYDNCANNYTRIDDNKDFIHKSVQILTPVYHIPAGAHNYKNNLLPLYKKVNNALAEQTDHFKREATKIIHQGHRIKRFQLKLDRTNLLFRHLVTELGQFHIAVYRATVAKDDKSILSDHDLARYAVRDLIKLTLDLEMLEYLDINRTQLLEIFDASYPPNPTKLYGADAQAVNATRNLMVTYIKACTVTHYKKAKEIKKHTTAMATVAAKMERATSTAAMASTEEALKKQAPAFPKNPKALADLISKTVTQELKKQTPSLPLPSALKRKQPEANKPTQQEAKPKRPAPPLAAPPAKKKRSTPAKKQGVDKPNPSTPAQPRVSFKETNQKPTPNSTRKKQPKPDRRRRHSKSSRPKRS
jgi:hypothetical protein